LYRNDDSASRRAWVQGARRPRYQVTFAVLAAGIGAFALLQSLVLPVLTTV